MTNLHEHLVALAAAQPNKPALIVCDKEGSVMREVSYANLLAEVESAAAGLVAAGIGLGERVALALDNPADQLIVTWAAWASGVVAVPLDSKRDTKEQEDYKLSLTQAKLVLRSLPPTIATSDSRNLEISKSQNINNEALVLFTSGTTAKPKGASLSLNNLVVNALGIKEWLKVTAQDRFMVVLPLHHINSTTFCLTTLLAGGTIVVPPAYSNSNFWGQAARTGATFTSLVPSIVFDQLARQKEFNEVKDALKFSRIQIGSAPVVASAVQEFIKMFGILLYQGYGQTETALRVTGVPMELSQETYMQLVADNAIGEPMPWATVEIADDAGNILKEGEEGELIVRGDALMQGYIGGPSTTLGINEEAFRDGWFLTGDVGYWKNVEGRKIFYLKGRKKELIIKGGINISPIAIEDALKKVSSDVSQAYIVGVADERMGEEAGAVICWRSGVDEAVAMRTLKARLWLGSEHMSAYESPAYLTSMAVGDLPTTSTGKVQRLVLKNQTIGWGPATELFKTNYSFEIVRAFSKHAEASHELYNNCWQPLTLTRDGYSSFLQKYKTIAAVDAAGKLVGQVSFAREGDKLVCVSICSASYTPKPVPEVSRVPTQQEVEKYVRDGLDPVLNFHTKLGAEFVELLPNARPDDKSAMGYQARMRYALPPNPKVDESAPISSQLIQAVLLLAHDSCLNSVEALSRPGALAAYLTKQQRQ